MSLVFLKKEDIFKVILFYFYQFGEPIQLTHQPMVDQVDIFVTYLKVNWINSIFLFMNLCGFD